MVSPTLITWIVIVIVFGIAGISFYLENKKIKQRIERRKVSGIIHFNHNEKYACNEARKPVKEKMTEDWDKVTCNNCLRVKFYK